MSGLFLARVEKFTLEELYTIARFCSIDAETIMTLVNKEYLKTKSKIRDPK